MTSCERISERMEITQTREISDYDAKPKLSAYPEERFGDEQLRWETPVGWVQAERTSMRPLNFTFGPNNEGECYLSIMPGSSGSTLDNINRWRKQMAQPEITEADLEKLPKKTLMGIQGTYVTIDGDFTGVGAAEAKPGYRMLGIIATVQGSGIFMKMTGPKALVEANTEAFDKFVASISLRMPPQQGGGAPQR